MNYALNLSADCRILSATFPQHASKDAVIVEMLPEGDIHNYLYVNGEYVFSPLPEPEEPEPGVSEVLDALLGV